LSASTNSDTRARGIAIREQRRDMGQIDPDLVRLDT